MSAWSKDFTNTPKDKPVLFRSPDYPLPFVAVWNAIDGQWQCEEGEDVAFVEVTDAMEWAAVPE